MISGSITSIVSLNDLATNHNGHATVIWKRLHESNVATGYLRGSDPASVLYWLRDILYGSLAYMNLKVAPKVAEMSVMNLVFAREASRDWRGLLVSVGPSGFRIGMGASEATTRQQVQRNMAFNIQTQQTRRHFNAINRSLFEYLTSLC